MPEKKKQQRNKKMYNKNKVYASRFKKSVLNNEIVLKSQQRFKSEAHNVRKEGVNKIALSSNDDKRLQAHDGITTYPCGYRDWESMQKRDAN